MPNVGLDHRRQGKDQCHVPLPYSYSRPQSYDDMLLKRGAGKGEMKNENKEENWE